MIERFDRLHLKLFAAIAGANVLLAMVAFAVFSRAFDQGFVEYLNRADEARLTPLVERLAGYFENEGSWREFSEAPDVQRAAWVVDAELPRASLAGMGLPYDPARAAEPVRAELLLHPAGDVLAVRFVNE